jgi:hypothetical protein
VDVQHGALVGAWNAAGGEVNVSQGDFTRLSIPYLPPEEYDYRIDFTRKIGFDVNMIFPAAGQSMVWKMGSWNSCYFGTWKGNPDAVLLQNFNNHVRHTAIIEVRKTTLTAYLDGKLMKSIEIGKSSSACTPDYRLPDPRTVGVGAWRSDLVFHRMLVRPVTGQDTPLPADIDALNAVSDEYWANAKNLMPQTLDPKNLVAGNWRIANGDLFTTPVRNARIQLNYAPPAEYDFRVSFTRVDGKSDVDQIVSAGGKQFVWKMDITGQSLFDTIGAEGRDANPTLLHTPGLVTNGTQHTSVICVRKDRIKAYVDGKLICCRITDFADMNIEENWKLALPQIIGIGFHNCSGLIHSIQIKDVTGQGKTVELPEPALPKERAF